MSNVKLWAGALTQVLIHDETGCPHSALKAIRLLDCLSSSEELDEELHDLCERASLRLAQSVERTQHAGHL